MEVDEESLELDQIRWDKGPVSSLLVDVVEGVVVVHDQRGTLGAVRVDAVHVVRPRPVGARFGAVVRLEAGVRDDVVAVARHAVALRDVAREQRRPLIVSSKALEILQNVKEDFLMQMMASTTISDE